MTCAAFYIFTKTKTMKKIIIAFAAAMGIGMVTPGFAQTADKLNPGDHMPAAETPMRNAVDGKDMTMKGAMGKNGVIVMFSCNTCPFVIKNQSITQKTIEYAKTHNVGMVIINSNEAKRDGDDSYKEMKKYAQQQGYTVPYLADNNSTVADLFGANHTPEIFLFNNQGRLVYKGAMNDNPSDPIAYKKMYITEAIDALIAGKEIDPKTTKSIGCSIKRKA